MKYHGALVYTLLSTKWNDQVTHNDLAWIYLFQSGKKILDYCEERFISKSKATEEMLKVCSECPDRSAIKKLAKYALGYKDVIGKENIEGIVANENNCNNVLAVLMDYKNCHFEDYNPMDKLILE